MTEANRTAARAEAEVSIVGGKLESAKLAVVRFEDEAMAARGRLKEARATLADLPHTETEPVTEEDSA